MTQLQASEHLDPQAQPATDPPMEGAGAGHVVAQILALGDLPELEEQGDRPLADQPAAIQQVKVRLQVSVGEVAVTIGELLAAREHHVFVLDREVDQPVDVVLAGRVVARGQLVAVDDRFAIRITQLPAPATS